MVKSTIIDERSVVDEEYEEYNGGKIIQMIPSRQNLHLSLPDTLVGWTRGKFALLVHFGFYETL